MVVRAASEKEQNSNKIKKEKKGKIEAEATTVNPEHFNVIKKKASPSIIEFLIMSSALR